MDEQNRQDSNLDLDVSELLGHPCHISISDWSKGISWTTTNDDEVEKFDFMEPLPLSLDFILKQSSFRSWVDSTPEDIVHLLAKYRCIDSQTLYLTSRYSNAYGLFTKSPTLFWYMIFCAKRERWTETKIVSLLDGSLATILNNCNLPPKESTLKFFQKIKFDTYRHSEYSLITTLINLNCWERLNELSSIDIRLAMIVSDFPLLIGSKLLRNHDGEEWSASEHQVLKDVRRLAGVLGHRKISILMGKFKNMDEVEKFSRKLDKRIQNRKVHKYEVVLNYAEYPNHHLKGNENIKLIENTGQLSTFDVLYRDSIQALILDNQYCAFAIDYPERALIGVELKGGILPRLHQVRSEYFQEAHQSTQNFARDWLASTTHRQV